MYWSLPHWQSRETLRPHEVGCHCERAPSSNWIAFETQSELNYGDSQHAFVSRNQRASFACVSLITTRYRARTNATDKSLKKKQIPHWPVTQGTKGLSCMHTEEVQTEFMTALSLLLLITSPPISGHQKPPHWSRQTRHHSFTCLLGAFVRWLLAEKGKQINTSPMGLTGNLYLGWNMSGTSLLDSFTVTGQLTGCVEAISPLSGHWKFILGHMVWPWCHYSDC